MKRILAVESVADALVERILVHAKKLKCGDPFDPNTDIGTVIHERAAATFEKRVIDAVGKGAKLLHGNDRRGALYPPTVVDRVPYDCELVHEETFGRVVAEAQISGIPALVSDRGALPETLAGGGIAVPLDAGLEAWLAALDRLWTAPAFYDRCAAAARAESTAEDRDPARVSARFLDILRRF